MDDSGFYEIGYGKPPRASQFTKGQSGNPNGRPKGSKNLAAVVLRESRQPVRVNGPKGPRTITKLEAAVMQIGNKAAQGELPAARELFGLVQRSEMESGSSSTREFFQESDYRVLENFRRRFEVNTSPASPPTTNSGENSQ